MVVSSFLELGVATEHTKRILELAYETGALLYGDFTLASGKKSDHYFEGKRLTLSCRLTTAPNQKSPVLSNSPGVWATGPKRLLRWRRRPELSLSIQSD